MQRSRNLKRIKKKFDGVKVEYKIEKSKEPEEEKTHIVVFISEVGNGCNYKRIFKGTYKDCLEFKRKRLGVENDKS